MQVLGCILLRHRGKNMRDRMMVGYTDDAKMVGHEPEIRRLEDQV